MNERSTYSVKLCQLQNKKVTNYKLFYNTYKTFNVIFYYYTFSFLLLLIIAKNYLYFEMKNYLKINKWNETKEAHGRK
jgi:hypothetical protein